MIKYRASCQGLNVDKVELNDSYYMRYVEYEKRGKVEGFQYPQKETQTIRVFNTALEASMFIFRYSEEKVKIAREDLERKIAKLKYSVYLVDKIVEDNKEK